jgi:adenylate cyclase
MINKKLLVSIIISLAVSAFLALLLYAGAFQDLSFRLSDRLYTEQRPLGEIVIIAIDDKSIQEIGRWPWPRDVFASAIEKLRNASVIGIDVSFFEASENDSELSNTIISNKNIVLVSECIFKEGNCTWQMPIFNASSGYANVLADKSGISRSILLSMENEMAFSAVLSEKYGKKFSENSGKLLIRFSRHKKISFSDLLNSNENFDGKIVIIGATAKDLHDEKATPIGVLSGVDIHASAVQTILTGKSLNYQNFSSAALIILLLSLLTSFIMFRFRIILSAVISLFIIIIYFLISLFAFDSGIMMNILYPSSSVILTFVFVTVFYYIREAKEKKWVYELFGKYVSPNVADELMKKGKKAVHLKGTRKTVTILFADMRGFTAMSEKISPRQVVSILNRYLGRMTDIVFKYNGTLDKYVGDEIMATYNVPLDLKDHALMAVKTAIEMQKESRKLMKVKYGIGINTGPVIVGNIGSKKRLDYTVIGDAVNLAARLCGKCEGDQILISEETFNLVKDKIKTHFIGEVQIKGKAKPIRVYEVVY